MKLLLLRYRNLRLIAFAAFLGVAYGPLIAAMVGTFNEPAISLGDAMTSRRLELLVRSLGFSSTIAVLTMSVGLLAAIAILRWLPTHAKKLQWLLLATVALPPTIPALSWSYTLALLPFPATAGILGNWLHAGVAQGMALVPFATGMSMVALAATDRGLLDAARVMVSPPRLLLAIAVPLARPALVSSAALIFLLSLLDYTIPSIFGVNIYSMEIFVAFSATHSVGEAVWLSLPLTACALALVAALSGLPNHLAQTAHSSFPRDGSLPWFLKALLALALSLTGAALLAPLLSFLPAFSDPSYLSRTIVLSGREVGYTLLTSAATAAIALVLAIGPAIELARGGRSARFLWGTCLLPFLTPPALTGIGLIALWSPVHVIDIYGTPWMTIAAELARFMPVSVIILATWLLRTDVIPLEAALVTGSSLGRILRKVVLPVTLPGLAAATGIAFVLSLGEIGANLLVTPAGYATLTMKTYNYLHYGGSQAAAGLCLLLIAMAIAGAALPAFVMNRRLRS